MGRTDADANIPLQAVAGQFERTGAGSPRGTSRVSRNGYAPVSRHADEEDEEADLRRQWLDGDDSKRKSRRQRRRRRILFFGLLGLIVPAITILTILLVACKISSVKDDLDAIFGNWGKPGTGTEGVAWYPTDFLRDVVPIHCHSHNDYWRKVPLFSALHAGCIGVEADVWLKDDELLVGHDTAALTRNRTFQSLYVNPLVEILQRQNPSTEFYNDSRRGVFDTDPDQTVTLLVDLKTEGVATWPWVVEQLEPLRSRGWLSYFEDGTFHQGPVTVVGTGNTPFDLVAANSTRRDAFFDAPLDGLTGSRFDSTNSYYASASFGEAVGRVWLRGMDSGQLEKVRAQLAEAHGRGLKARYWDLPAWPIGVRNRVWNSLVHEGVDMLNVDDLKGAARGVWTDA